MVEYIPYRQRKKQAERAGLPVLYQYDYIPPEFKIQAHGILVHVVGEYDTNSPLMYIGYSDYPQNEWWKAIADEVRHERGILELGGDIYNPSRQLLEYLISESDPDWVLQALEIAFRSIPERVAQFKRGTRPTQIDHWTVKELNDRFRQHDLGYEFVNDGSLGVIIRKDSEFIHAEVVEPAIAGLHAAGFDGPLHEFLDAHRHYRHGEFDDAMNDALKAFESTLKAICAKRGWAPKWDTAKPLVSAILDNGLIPSYLQNYLSGIRIVLESGVPTLRNKESGHGDGPQRRVVPEHVVAFTLHLTASNIVFLLAADKELDSST